MGFEPTTYSGDHLQLFGSLMLNDHGYIWRRNWLYFAAKNGWGGLGPGVSALPRGPMDVFENYIFEISVKN